jgi:hypothetical protein
VGLKGCLKVSGVRMGLTTILHVRRTEISVPRFPLTAPITLRFG